MMEHILNDGFVTEGPVLTVLSPVSQERHPRFQYIRDFPEISVEIIKRGLNGQSVS